MRLSLTASIASASVALAMIATPSAAQTFGSNFPDNGIGPFGRDAFYSIVTGAVAESFVTPLGSPELQSFTFYLGDFFDGTDLLIEANVFAFSGDHIIGPALYTSTVRSGSSNQADFDPFDFSNVNLVLTPGTTYALLLRTTVSSPDGSTNLVGTTTNDTFSLGQLYTSTGSTDADLSANGAFVASDPTTFGSDAALQVTFTATPEPASLVLMTSGLFGVGIMARRRRSR
jgi:hypothetical protein